jgi:branched-chain amino acid aminotransferase
MSAHLVSHNGLIVPAEQKIFSAGNRMLLFGDGFFETMRVAGGRILFFKEHSARITRAMALLHLEWKNSFGFNNLEEALQALIAAHGSNGNGKLRVQFYREGEGSYQPQTNQIGFVAQWFVLPDELYALNESGIRAGVYRQSMKSADQFSSFKSGNALVMINASVWMEAAQLQEAIILNSYGRICEATSSNVFIVKGDQVITPSLDEGCVHGVMRNVVITCCRQIGIDVLEKPLSEVELLAADECWLTNAVSGLRWLSECGVGRFEPRLVRKVHQQLLVAATA